jgi:hypothetical protein
MVFSVVGDGMVLSELDGAGVRLVDTVGAGLGFKGVGVILSSTPTHLQKLGTYTGSQFTASHQSSSVCGLFDTHFLSVLELVGDGVVSVVDSVGDGVVTTVDVVGDGVVVSVSSAQIQN